MEQRPSTPPLRLAGADPRTGPFVRSGSPPTGGEEDLAKLTHELANLLDGSQRHLNLALRQLSADQDGSEREEVLRQLRVLHSALERMNRVVGTFRGQRPGRIGAPEYTAHAGESEPMAAVLQHAVDVVAPIAAEKRITIDVSLSRDLPEVTAGPIYPVVSNALRNALEASEAGGRIELTAEVIEEQIVIAVRDEGVGIDPAMLGRLFELGATSKATGSGVGLALSREIVERMGGTIALVNNPHRGATLRVTLPLHNQWKD